MTEEMKLTRDDFDEVDVEALDRALAIALADDERSGSDQIKSKLAEDWWDAASSASYRLQYRNLGLNPSQDPPCFGDKCPITGHVKADAAKLLKRMRSFGISKFDVDPITAIATAKSRK